MTEAAYDANAEAIKTFERFLALERDHNLFEIRADGIPVWERIRSTIGSELLQDAAFGETGEKQPSSRYTVDQLRRDVKNLGGRLVGKVEAAVHAPLWADDADYLFWGRARRLVGPDGTWWDAYCDPLHNSLEYEYVHVERPKGSRHFRPAKTENLYYLDLLDDLGSLRRRFGRVGYSLSEKEERELAQVEATIEKEFGKKFDVRGMVESEMTERLALFPLYDWLVTRIDPGVAIVTISETKLPFIEACAERGVPTVELQHGITGEYHLGYTYPEDVNVDVFPDYFLTFGQYWSDQCNVPLPDDRVRAVGFPYLDCGRERYADVPTKEQIVFVSQDSIGGALSQAAVTLSESPAIDPEIVYKLSWAESNKWESRYPWLVDSDVRVFEDTNTQLYRLFAESSAQVGVYSTAVFEGIAFGLDTYLLDLPGLYAIRGLVESTAAAYCGSTTDLVEAVATDAAGDVDADRFFEPNALVNVERELEAIRRAHD